MFCPVKCRKDFAGPNILEPSHDITGAAKLQSDFDSHKEAQKITKIFSCLLVPLRGQSGFSR
jgi:hypothetical protein